MKTLLTLVVAGAATFASPVMTLAAPTSIAAPFPIVNIDRGITKINAFTESNRHRHGLMKRVTVRSRSRLNSFFDSYASSPYDGARGFASPIVKPVSPGDPGNPYLNSDFDRAVERHEYNGP
jgi:hypothetical protein